MAHIKEPNGVDFIIQSEPLTDEAKKEISAFIKVDKAKRALKAKRATGKGSGKAKQSA